jgi:glucokinase
MFRVGHQKYIKSLNRALVLDTIRSDQPISRAALARRLGLSRSTISSIIAELLTKKFVIELGLGDSTNEGGRRGMQLAFNAKSSFGIGVDIKDSGIMLVMTDLNGSVRFERKTKPTNKVPQVVNDIQSFIHESGIDQKQILGMGIAVPSLVGNTKDIVVDAPSLGWYNLNLKEVLAASFPVPIFVNNDVDCSALGERWLGKGSQTDNMFFMSIGTGIGGSIIANGQLIQGSQYSAGEIGYFIDKEDTLNFDVPITGKFGPFERKISPLIKEFQETGIASKALIIDLSIAIANLVNLLNPEKIVIGGVEGPTLEPILEEVKQNVNLFSPLQTNIEIACLGERSQALGALWYLFEQIVFSP